jgi:hypothetical protein
MPFLQSLNILLLAVNCVGVFANLQKSDLKKTAVEQSTEGFSAKESAGEVPVRRKKRFVLEMLAGAGFLWAAGDYFDKHQKSSKKRGTYIIETEEYKYSE